MSKTRTTGAVLSNQSSAGVLWLVPSGPVMALRCSSSRLLSCRLMWPSLLGLTLACGDLCWKQRSMDCVVPRASVSIQTCWWAVGWGLVWKQDNHHGKGAEHADPSCSQCSLQGRHCSFLSGSHGRKCHASCDSGSWGCSEFGSSLSGDFLKV